MLEAYQHWLWKIIKAVPSWMGEEVLSASQAVDNDRAAMWTGAD